MTLASLISSADMLTSSHRYILYLGGIRDIMVTIVGNGHGDMSSNPGQDCCISHITNTLGKGMNPTILLPAMGK